MATTAALVTATAMLFGWNIWIEFWQNVVPQQQWLTVHGHGLLFAVVSSVFYGGAPSASAIAVDWALQDIASALAFAAVVWTYWKRRDPALSLALFVTATFLVTPYILNYDMVVFGFVVALLRERADNTKRDHALLIAVWTLPVTMMLAAFALDSAGADRADRVCGPSGLALGAKRRARSPGACRTELRPPRLNSAAPN